MTPRPVVRLRSGADSVELAWRERIDTGQAQGDTRWSVSVVMKAFCGATETVWLGRHELADFLRALQALDRDRRGRAELVAMSPSDFTLAITATDHAGHLAAEGWVGADFMGHGGNLRHRVSFSIEIEPSTLPDLVRAFQRLA
jgi:hypothetical protein